MKSKTLIKEFGYNTLVAECEKQGWRLPTLEEAQEIDTPSECFYLEQRGDLDEDNHAVVYYPKSDQVGMVHKLFMLESVVVVLPKVCDDCEYSYFCVLKKFACDEYGKDPKTWGCTEFKRKM